MKGYKMRGCVLNKANRTVDHVIPRVLGGANDTRNYKVVCRPCNNRKGERVVIPNYRQEPPRG
jgi:5-methylcytosine-specific restriction endonuclease McrA